MLQFELARDVPEGVEALAVPAFADDERAASPTATADDGLDWIFLGGRGFTG
jgi:hypothetical protein